MKQIMRILDYIITALLLLVVCCNIYILAAGKLVGRLYPDIFGWSGAVVISGSMAEEIKVNDFVVVHRQKDYKAGDIISFVSGDAVVTHRIAAEEDGGFITKGDANNTEDSGIVEKADVIGRVVLVIPKVGVFISFLRTPLGLASIAVIAFLLLILPSFLKKEDEN